MSTTPATTPADGELLQMMAEAMPVTACVIEGKRKSVQMNLDELLEFSRALLALVKEKKGQ